MKARLSTLIVLLTSLALLGSFIPMGSTVTANEPETVRQKNTSVMFIENVGQFAEEARFRVRGGNGTIWLADDAIWITIMKPPQTETSPRRRTPPTLERFSVPDKDQQRKGVNLKLSFVGANPNSRLEPFSQLDTVVSYFIGNDPEQWYPDVPVWDGVHYRELYPDVDLEITSEAGRWTWRMIARDGADLSAIRLQVEGVEVLTLDGTQLNLTTAVGDFTLPLLTADWLGLPVLVGHEVLHPFVSPVNQPTIRLQDNPDDLLYSTFLGGKDEDVGSAIAVDDSGNIYITGWTLSSNFPTTVGAFDTSYNGSYDAYVVKVNAAGTGLTYAAFLGGGSSDAGSAIAVDESGNAYLTGESYSSNFPTTLGAFDTSHNGSRDAFVAKVNASGTNLSYATFLGGSSDDKGWAIAVGGTGNAYITGWTLSSNFPTTLGAFDTSYNGGEHDAFVAKVNSGGTNLLYSTFLGGSDRDEGYGIAVDGVGSTYITGWTFSSNFPTTAGAFDTSLDYYDAFVVKLNIIGTVLSYATFVGGSSSDGGNALAVDGEGNAYLTGYTYSSDFPTTTGAFDSSYNGNLDAFVAKVNASGTALSYTTFVGGSDYDGGWGIALNEGGNAYLIGETWSSDFPTTSEAFDTSYNTWSDVFVVKVNATGTALSYATFLGGSDGDECSSWDCGIAVDEAGSAYMAGTTFSHNFPTTDGAFDTSYNGGWGDAFVTKLAMEGGEPGPDPDLELAQQFAPYMYFHRDDIYRPISVTVPVEKAKRLYGEGVPPDTSPTLDELASSQWRDRENAYLDLKGDGSEGLHNVYLSEISPLVEPLALARVDRTTMPGKIAIQYWLFYYDNPWKNHHEGDWEMIELVLDSDEEPLYAVYGQHFNFDLGVTALGGSKRWWQNVEKEGEHPVVYAAKGSHATYFKPYDYFQGVEPLLGGIDETAPTRTEGIVPVQLLPVSPIQDTWLYFRGHWGDEGKSPETPWGKYPDQDGPPGPSQKGEKWSNPVAWSETLPWDEAAYHNLFRKLRSSVPSPLDVHLYELPSGAHVGWKNGGLEEGIPHAEYFDNPATGWRTVLLHEVSPEFKYKVELGYRPPTYQMGTQVASEIMTVTLSFPDVEASSVITASYLLSDTWEISTTATISVHHGSDFDIRIDIDGDETIDEEVAPSALEETKTDFTAPSVITDLEVLTSTIGMVVLTWTAPGDDGNVGTATAYDIRYSTDSITYTNWISATQLISLPIPSFAGSTEVFTATQTPGGRHYFALKAVDDLLQSSGLSNIVEAEVPYGLYLPLVLRNR